MVYLTSLLNSQDIRSDGPEPGNETKDEMATGMDTPGFDPVPSGLKSSVLPLDQAHRLHWNILLISARVYRDPHFSLHLFGHNVTFLVLMFP